VNFSQLQEQMRRFTGQSEEERRRTISEARVAQNMIPQFREIFARNYNLPFRIDRSLLRDDYYRMWRDGIGIDFDDPVWHSNDAENEKQPSPLIQSAIRLIEAFRTQDAEKVEDALAVLEAAIPESAWRVSRAGKYG